MSLFGGSSFSNNRPSLFGSSGNTQPQQESSLFGSNSLSSQPQKPTTLFGASQQQQQQQQPQASQLNQGSNLFSNLQPSQQSGGSLFGGPTSTQQQQQPAQPQQQQGEGLFSRIGQPSQTAPSLAGSTLVGSQQGQQAQRNSIWQPQNALQPREKSVPEQMQTILEKWSPESGDCGFQRYFYNSVKPETVPYYGPDPGEDEQKWEEALSARPYEGSIPVLCRGFAALGNRLRIQVETVRNLQARLHEISESLKRLLQQHDLEISVRAADAKRRHLALSQRSLRLATKVQILRNRGYTLDSAEEELKQKLSELERNSFDPMLNGRTEEIWARMVGIRERVKYLQEEAESAGKGIGSNEKDTFSDDVILRAKKILGDFDSEIGYLRKEMEDIRKDWADTEVKGNLPTSKS